MISVVKIASHTGSETADGRATVLVVLGYEKAMAVAQEQGLAVYFIRRQGDAFVETHTPAFEPFLEQPGTEY